MDTMSSEGRVRFERLRERLPPPTPAWMHRPLRVVPVIVTLNAVVFVAWQVARFSPGLQTFLINNFLVSWVHLVHGHLWSLLTAAFSHSEWWHFGINMVVLWSFGSVLERLFGWQKFLAFYVTAALVSSVAHCLVSLAMGRANVPALGASGAVSALLVVYGLLFPHARILVFGMIPVPALVGVLFFVGLDVWGLIAQGQGGGLPIGHGAHLGGALAGAVFWFVALRGRFQPPEQARPATLHGLRMTPAEAELFDRLRTKLATHGPDSLSADEMEFLRNIRERALR